jgi:hypothetical protein
MTRTTSTSLIGGLALLCLGLAGNLLAQEVLPRPEPPFHGTIGRTTKESTKDFPKEVQAPKGAPNILLILTDDVGFGASSTFGGLGKGGTGTILVDSKQIAQGRIERTLAFCRSPSMALSRR